MQKRVGLKTGQIYSLYVTITSALKYTLIEENKMPNRDRILLLLQTLQKQSDDETWLTTADLRAVLEAEGYECSIRTLRKEIQSIIDSGYNIEIQESEGQSTKYAWKARKWTAPELQILIDAVSSAQFIPEKQSRKLIARLTAMAGPSHQGELKPQILISEHIKAKNRDMIHSVQAIRKAMDRDKMISFRYLQYTPDKQQIPKHAGTEDEQYIVSPYATVWNDDRYYLVGWSDTREQVVVFRIDRMKVPNILKKDRVPAPEDFDVRNYTDKVFRMYGGPEENVTLKCKMEILDQVIDQFGDGIDIRPGKKDTFRITVPVSLSTTFYAWVFQYVGKMSIICPEYVREAYAGYLEEALDDVLGED